MVVNYYSNAKYSYLANRCFSSLSFMSCVLQKVHINIKYNPSMKATVCFPFFTQVLSAKIVEKSLLIELLKSTFVDQDNTDANSRK